MTRILLISFISFFVIPSFAGTKKLSKKAKPIEAIHAKVKWGEKVTKMQLSLGKSPKISLHNSNGSKRVESLDTKDSAYILKEFQRLPASTMTKNCDTPMTIEIQSVPSDGRNRKLCVSKQPKTAKSYSSFVNLMEFASRKKVSSKK